MEPGLTGALMGSVLVVCALSASGATAEAATSLDPSVAGSCTKLNEMLQTSPDVVVLRGGAQCFGGAEARALVRLTEVRPEYGVDHVEGSCFTARQNPCYVTLEMPRLSDAAYWGRTTLQIVGQ
jgi:hypothetical protein